MNTKKDTLSISDIKIDITRKKIKNIHLGVYPPYGEIRISAPINTTEDVIKLFAISKLPWIKKNVKKIKDQERENIRKYVGMESHYFKGKRYLLDVIFTESKNRLEFDEFKGFKLYVKEDTTQEHKRKIMKEWYRKELKKELPILIEKWEDIMGVKSSAFGVKQMKTKWGTCNVDTKKIWLNLELIKKPPHCLEYVIVHELVHLLERSHNQRFIAYMDKFMPKWKIYQDELNNLPI